MSLHVYRELKDIPSEIQFINSNDLFFDAHTFIQDSDLVREVLNKIENAECSDGKTFIGRTKDFGKLYKEYLSSGTKTLINIIQNPDKCFNLSECGSNALEFLQKISEGHVFAQNLVFYPDNEDDYKCDIVVKDNHFINIFDFVEFMRGQQ